MKRKVVEKKRCVVNVTYAPVSEEEMARKRKKIGEILVRHYFRKKL